MTQELELFKGKKLRVKMLAGEPYFCVKDVCDEVGLKSEEVQRRLRSTDMVSTHAGILVSIDTPTETGMRAMAYVNEVGLYEIVGNSRKPKAREFHQEIILALPGLRQNSRIAELEARIAELERGGGHLLLAGIPDISPRSRLNMIIRDFVARQVSGYSYEDAWNNLYYQYKYRYHGDLKAGARSLSKKLMRVVGPLDYAEEKGLIVNLVNLAAHIFAEAR